MKINDAFDTYPNAYPYVRVATLFAGVGSLTGGIIAELCLLIIFREANFSQIGYQPLVYVGLFGLIPALLTGIILAIKKIKRSDSHNKRTTFMVGFIVSALLIATLIIYLGVHSLAEIAVLLASMLIIGIFGGINATVASFIALPKPCKSRFDNHFGKEHDNHQGYILNNHD